MEAIWWNGDKIYESQNGTPTRLKQSEEGLGFPPRVLTFDEFAAPAMNTYRGMKYANRVYTVTYKVAPDPYTKEGLDAELAQWHNWHDPANGECVLRRLTAANNNYYLDAVARAPEIGRADGGFTRLITQSYEAASPFWRSASESSATDNYNGATPVNITVANAGETEAWMRFVITGIVNAPKLTFGDYEIEINVNMTHANDVLAIVCEVPASVLYTPNGGSATKYYGYRSNATNFNGFKAAAGNNTVTLSATSGTAACVVYWYNYYGTIT